MDAPRVLPFSPRLAPRAASWERNRKGMDALRAAPNFPLRMRRVLLLFEEGWAHSGSQGPFGMRRALLLKDGHLARMHRARAGQTLAAERTTSNRSARKREEPINFEFVYIGSPGDSQNIHDMVKNVLRNS